MTLFFIIAIAYDPIMITHLTDLESPFTALEFDNRSDREQPVEIYCFCGGRATVQF